MKRPSFQFYPADWRNNANLRRCSWEARGVWIEVMGLLHDSDTYGMLRWPLKEIAQALGAPVKLVQELATKGVVKGCDSGECEQFIYTPRSGRKDGEPVLLVPVQAGPIWYSSRMVKDEYVRTIRGESSRFGAVICDPPMYSPMPPLDDGSSTTSSTTSPSLRSGDTAVKPRTSRPRRELKTLAQYLEACKAEGRKPVPPEASIRGYCRDAGIADEMLQIGWIVFKDRHLNAQRDKRYKDWLQAFENSVKDRWYKLWFTDGEEVKWTPTGLQEKAVIEARQAEQAARRASEQAAAEGEPA